MSALLSVVAQFGAIGIAVSRGIRPGDPIDYGDATQLLSAANADHAASVLGLSLATISPFVALPLGLGLYVVLKQAKAHALFGTVMFYVGMTIALIHEVLRITLFVKLPPAYMVSSDSTKAAILVLGDVLQYAEAMFDLMAFIIMFGLGFFAFALAILKLPVVPHWLGWALLVPAVGVGIIAFPLGYFGFSSAGMLVLPGMLVFFIWLTAIGIVLLRWNPLKTPL